MDDISIGVEIRNEEWPLEYTAAINVLSIGVEITNDEWELDYEPTESVFTTDIVIGTNLIISGTYVTDVKVKDDDGYESVLDGTIAKIDLSVKQDKIDADNKLPYSLLSGTPTIPDELSDLADDTNHRLVTDTEKSTWNSKYNKPDGGIPESDLSGQVQSSLNKADTAYQKPESGIPESHLSQEVRDKLNREGATVLSGTTEYWESRTGFIPDANTIIIYTDKAIIDGENVPGIKIGSGNGYVQDLAFVGDETADTLLDHINNNNIHITALERTSWSHKIDIDETGGEVRNETIRFIR